MDFHCIVEGCSKTSRYQYRACDECAERRSRERWEAFPVVEWDGDTPLYSQVEDEYFDEAPDMTDFQHVGEGTYDEMRLVICEPVKARWFEVREWIQDELAEEDESTGVGPEADAVEKIVNEYLQSLTPLSWTPGKTRPNTTTWKVEVESSD